MGRCLRLGLLGVACVIVVPWAAYAQASIVGAVKDSSGAVLPGVTVEAASPALIEKTRSVVTDGTGQYRIENLRPGVYTVTFTLVGFNTVKREGVELSGTFTATVPAEMRVGAVEETITVTSQAAIVDVQSTTSERVITQQILDAIPAARIPTRMAELAPNVTMTVHDVGGLTGDGPVRGNMLVHGNADARTLVNGVSLVQANGTGTMGAVNMATYSEMAVDTGGATAEQREGGVRMNLIPRDGGNTPRGYFFGAFANRAMQGDNYTDALKAAGLGAPNAVKKLWDLNPAFGGPIKQDRLWFQATGRYTGTLNTVPVFFNKNAGNPNVWTYLADTARRPAWTENVWKNGDARITWQATPKHKLAVSYDYSWNCDCPRTLTGTQSPEAVGNAFLYPKRILSADWTAPFTNRLLFDAAFLKQDVYIGRYKPNAELAAYYGTAGATPLIGVTEQSTGQLYRGHPTDITQLDHTIFARAGASYITGAHSLKVGVGFDYANQNYLTYAFDAPLTYRFNNGVPNQLTMYATPYDLITQWFEPAIFVQDRWTSNRLTLSGGLRYDYRPGSYPSVPLTPGLYTPTRNVVLPEGKGTHWHDLSPRAGLVYDLTGDGKTALKLSANKYLAVANANDATFGRVAAPVNSLALSTTRSWTDTNRNFVADCDLLNPAAQTVAGGDVCGAMSNPNFGTVVPSTTYDPAIVNGFGKRPSNWQFSAGVQREILPRMAVDVSYNRTIFQNFIVTDNLAVAASDYDRFSITAPVDPRLPDGGGNTIAGLYDLKPTAFGRKSDNFLTFANNYGKQISHWDGIDASVNARPSSGVLMQGGFSIGRTLTDNCEITAKLPEVSPLNPFCRTTETLTNVKALATYTVSRIDVQLSGTFQSLPGPQILANYTATNAVVSPSLGRNLAGGAANATVSLVAPGLLHGERLNQLDVRVGKIVKFGRVRSTLSLDLYNALNANPVLSQSNAYATWLVPQTILNARFAKVGVQFDF